MSTALEATRTTVETAAERCEQAAVVTETTRNVADEKVQWSQMMGLTALGEGMQRIAETLTDASMRWTSVHEAVTAAVAALGQVPLASSRDDALGRVDTAVEQLNQARVTATAASTKTSDAHALAVEAGSGSVTAAVSEMVAVGPEATATIEAAQRAVEEYRQQLLDAYGTGPAFAVSGGSVSAASGRSVPAAVRRLAEQLPVWRKFQKTRALAYTSDEPAEVEFISGEDMSAAEGLHQRYAARLVTTDHAEGHLAARMRQPGGPRDVTVVINKEPCGGPEGCDATLPAIVPRDATVWVYVRDAGGVRSWGTYRGTGEGIQG